MNARRRIAIAGCALALTGAPLAGVLAQAPTPSKTTAIAFGGTEYLHRWSKGTQHEFTPRGDEDLSRWRDMVTINVHDGVTNGDQLAGVANQVLGNYKSNGKILRADSRPRTAERPAEHFVAALFGNPSMVEAAFARFVLVDGTGAVVVYSHRIYGKDAAAAMGEWLKANGPTTERTLMSWDRIPPVGRLKQLPQSR